MNEQDLGSTDNDWRADLDIFSEWGNKLYTQDASFAQICIDGLVESLPLSLDNLPII